MEPYPPAAQQEARINTLKMLIHAVDKLLCIKTKLVLEDPQKTIASIHSIVDYRLNELHQSKLEELRPILEQLRDLHLAQSSVEVLQQILENLFVLNKGGHYQSTYLKMIAKKKREEERQQRSEQALRQFGKTF